MTTDLHADPESHYYVQNNRRSSRIEEWRKIRRELRAGASVEVVHSPIRNLGIGMIAGPDTDMPTRTIDARILELAPGVTSSTHRHTHDAVMFVLSGQGTSVIGGREVRWGPWDAIHTPSWAWHHHQAGADGPARLLAVTDAPLLRALRLNWVEDAGVTDRAEEHAVLPAGRGDDPSAYGAELRAANEGPVGSAGARVHTPWSEVTLRRNPKGTSTALLIDSSLGYETSGLTIAMFELAPGQAQSKHRHPGEAFLYIVEGSGHSVIEGERYDWAAGDTVMVHQYAWHQHFNDDPDKRAVVLRIHQWESMIDIMQCMMDPVPMYEDDPEMVKATAGGGVWQQRSADADHHH